MDLNKLPTVGAARQEIQGAALDHWLGLVRHTDVLMLGFDPAAPLAKRLAWARSQGLAIGVIAARYSHKKSNSILEQVLDSMEFAVRNQIYVPPEFVCADEKVTGRKSRRDGLERAKLLLVEGPGEVLVIYKLSRLLRTCYKSVAFVQEEIVEEGRRAVSVTQNVDTRDEANWKNLVYLYGLMDESLLAAIADHVRSGLKQLFRQGYCTGGLTLGYDAVVTDGPRTKLERLRTKPAVNEQFRVMFNEHVDLHLGGMSITEGWRQWVTNGGAVPRREKKGRICYSTYRRMLSNPRYIGVWAFGRMTNIWLSKRETVTQREQPENDIVVRRVDELRVVDDERFLRLQKLLERNRLGPRTPKKKGAKALWDYTTKFFVCGSSDCKHCGTPFYQSGTDKPVMMCKSMGFCPQHVIVRRDEAVKAVCEKLSQLLLADEGLVQEVVGTACLKDSDLTAVHAEIADSQCRRTAITAKIKALLDQAGEGTDEDRRETRAKLASARQDRQSLDCSIAQLQGNLTAREAMEPDRIRERLAQFRQLMEDAGNGQLGESEVFRAVRVFELLTGGRIVVEAVQRSGRKNKAVLGRFDLHIAAAVLTDAGYPSSREGMTPVSVWLRPLPQCDAVVERVHVLVDVDQLGFADAADQLKASGEKIDQYGVERAYRRYYQMLGQKVPKRPYNNGRPRRQAKATIAAEKADEVKALLDEGLLLVQIAGQLGLRSDEVTAAKRYWYESRGLPVPDGRKRRKSLEIKNRRSA